MSDIRNLYEAFKHARSLVFLAVLSSFFYESQLHMFAEQSFFEDFVMIDTFTGEDTVHIFSTDA